VAVVPLDPAVTVTDRAPEGEPIGQVEIRQESSLETKQFDFLVRARPAGPHFEGREEPALDLDAKAPQSQEKSRDRQPVSLAHLSLRGQIAIAPNHLLIEGEPGCHEAVADQMVGQGNGVTMELTNRVADMESAAADLQFHPRPVRTNQDLRAFTKAKKHGATPIPAILHQGITVDDPRFLVLVKQGIVVEVVAQCPAQQVRGWRPGVVFEPGEMDPHDVHGFHIIIPQEGSSSDSRFRSRPRSLS